MYIDPTEKDMLEEFKNSSSINDYTIKSSIWYSLTHETKKYLTCVLKKTWQKTWKHIALFMTLIGFFGGVITNTLLPDQKQKVMNAIYFLSALLVLLIFLSILIRNLYKFSREKLSSKINTTEIVFLKNSFINMFIRLLNENAKANPLKKHDLVFAIGINKTALKEFIEDPNNTTVVQRYPGILMHFYLLMKNHLSIDIHDAIKAKTAGVTDIDATFPNGILNVRYTITHGKGAFEKLNGTSFTVAYYINSYSDGISELVANPRVSIIGLFNYYNEHLGHLHDKSTPTTLVLPLIGTGGGRLPFRNALLEIANNIERSNALMPSRIIIPIYREQILENSFETVEILEFLNKRIKSYHKTN